MARIAGVNIPEKKHAVIALTAIYGIGRVRAGEICDAAGVPRGAKVQSLTEAITPHLHTLRENVRTKWQNLLQQAQDRTAGGRG